MFTRRSSVMVTASHDTYQQTAQIDPEVFFRDFLSADPKYGAVAPLLESLRREMGSVLGRKTMTLSQFIDMTSIEYDERGEVVAKDDEILKALARAMKQVNVTREVLKIAASSGLTPEQIAEGPTSIKVPVSMLCNGRSFSQFAHSLNEQYHECRDFPSLIYAVYASRVHQKPLFLLFENEASIIAYASPAWSMQDMLDCVVLRRDRVILNIYNAKTPIKSFCDLVRRTPGGHLKGLYLGKWNT